MAILQNILKESWGHYQGMKQRIESRLRKLPQGSVLKRKLAGHDYYYLKVREGNRVISKYLGREKPKDLEKAIEERRLLQKQLREVRQNIRLLKKIQPKKHHAD